MRLAFVLGALLGGFLLAASAQAETRVFIIANADGYGIDRCLATGDHCGHAIATAYCRAREFAEARSYRRVEKSEITGTATAETHACKNCEEYVAIECSR